MKPNPFWPLNHLTVPVGIYLLQSTPRVTITRFQFNWSMSLGRARGRIQKGTAANRTQATYSFDHENASTGTQNKPPCLPPGAPEKGLSGPQFAFASAVGALAGVSSGTLLPVKRSITER